MIAVDGYQITEQLAPESHCALYAATDLERDRPTMIFCHPADRLSASDLAILRERYERIKAIHSENLLHVYDFRIVANEQRDDFVVFICENQNLRPLTSAVPAPWTDLHHFFAVAIGLAKGTNLLHQNGILLKEVNPSTLLFRTDTHQLVINVPLILLSRSNPIAQRDVRGLYDKRFLEQVLPYISPEQTGRVSRPVDHRSDFYAFGVLFYEWLTGRTPFASSDPLESIHAHLARPPLAPTKIRTDIPEILSRLTLKLLAKMPAERYQSAFGLLSDLERCRDQYVATGTISTFALGNRDAPEKLNLSTRLFGREAPLAKLLTIYEKVKGGAFEIVDVVGAAGIGKTRLVEELRYPVNADGGLFGAGKYTPFHQNIPYSGIIEAFRGILQKILQGSDEAISAWRKNIRAALGPHAALITGFLPELDLILGPTATVGPMQPDVKERLFARICVSFLRVFANKEHPLVIFLDDLQWIDSASLALIQQVLSGPSLPYCLVIGAYRDGDMTPDHPLYQSDQLMRSKGVPMGMMSLGPIGQDNVRQMILDTLSKNVADIEALTRLVHAKTHGNPFFVGQFIQSLYLRDLLFFDYQTGVWRWHESGIKSQAYTDNVIELMSSEIRKLTAEAREVLKIAACVGNRFDFQILADVSRAPAQRMAQGLLQAVEAGFVIPESGGLALLNEIATGKQTAAKGVPVGQDALMHDSAFSFMHDRVHQAVYDLVPENNRKSLHYEIGRLLLQRLDQKGLWENIFTIVNHLSHGVTFLAGEEERSGHAHLYLWAGCKAKEGTAYQLAVKYFNIGIALLAKDCWDDHYDLAFALYREKMECAFLNRDHDAAEHLFQFIFLRARSEMDKATLLYFKMVMHAGLGQHEDAVRIGMDGLATLGLHLRQGRKKYNELLELIRLRLKHAKVRAAILARRPPVADARQQLILKMLLDLAFSVYMCNPHRMLAIAAKIVELTFRHGHSPAAGVGFIIFSAALCAGLGDYRRGVALGTLALEHSDRNGKGPATQVLFYYAVAVSHWQRHLQVGIDLCRQGLHHAIENGDLNFAGYHIQSILIFLFASGAPLDKVEAECAKHADFIVNSKDRSAYNYVCSLRQTIKCLQGQTSGPNSLDDRDFREAVHIQRMINQNVQSVLLRHYLLKMQLLYMMGDIRGAAEVAHFCARRIDYHIGTIIVPEFYFYQAMTLLAHLPQQPPGRRVGIKNRLRLSLLGFRKMARHCPENFEHKLLLVKGELARVQGRFEKALTRFQNAIASARKHGFLHMEALAAELAARMAFHRGLFTVARAYMQEAHAGYRKFGATAKCDILRRTYPQLLARSLSANEPSPVLPIDYATVANALQTVSTEIVLDRLLEKLMKIVIENAGAQRVLFVLPKEDGFEIKARSSIGGAIRITSQAPAAVAVADELLLPAVHFVQHTHEPLVVEDLQLNPEFRTDSYVIRNKPKSLLCLPVLRQSDLVAILYMENNITTAAFTPDRVETVQLIASQAAISIENARLYEEVSMKERDLKALSENLRSLSSELLLTEERERRRIAVELHDRIGHALANVKMQISILQETDAADERVQMLTKVGELIDQSIQDTQSLTFELSPPVLYDLGLEAAIEWLVDQMQEQYRLPVTLLDDQKPKPLDESIRVLAFQAVRELLFNVVKHAHAHQAWIRLQREERNLRIEIADDGIGIQRSTQDKQDVKKGGFGLFSIRERLKHFGGRLEMDAAAGKGTRIALIVPMRPIDEEET